MITLIIPGRATFEVQDFAEASTVYAVARDGSGEGASTFPFGSIEQHGQTVAVVSYNAKVWEPFKPTDRRNAPNVLLFDPYA